MILHFEGSVEKCLISVKLKVMKISTLHIETDRF